jgi:hypothetical protein
MMFIYGVVAFLILAAVSSTASTMMKIRVNNELKKDERFSWWSRDYSDVGRKHRQLFPESSLPDIARFSAWMCLLLLAAAILISMRKI